MLGGADQRVGHHTVLRPFARFRAAPHRCEAQIRPQCEQRVQSGYEELTRRRTTGQNGGVKKASKDENQMMDQVIARLVASTAGSSAEEITRLVHEEHSKLDGRPVRDYVAVLVERSAKKRLHHEGSLFAA